jgi:hypothetical protein
MLGRFRWPQLVVEGTVSRTGGIMSFRLSLVAALFLQLWFGTALAQPELEACRSSGLVALKERNPSISDVWLDMDSMTVAKANAKVEDTPFEQSS